VSKDPDRLEPMEDRLVLGLMDRLNESWWPSVGDLDDGRGESIETLIRLYTETLGLLPYELEPLAPPPALKERLLERLGGRPTVEATLADEEAAVVPIATAGRFTRWALPLAAGLALVLLGISGWQFRHIEEQEGTIEQLSGLLSEANQATAELAQYRDELLEAKAKLAVVTASGVEVCSLYPVEDRLAGSSPKATLFVAPDHQHWYLRIEGLEPCPADHAYQLWFHTGEGEPVSAGTFDVEPGQRQELSSATMPAGTIAVSVTLEPAGGSSTPSGPSLLYGDEVMRIL
jgi:anti-sigma-K factor RskA